MRRWLLASLAVLCGVGALRAETSVSGGIAAVTEPELDLVGELDLSIGLVESGPADLTFRLETTTTIIRSVGDFTFELRDLIYDVELEALWRRERRWRWGLIVAHRGRERVDADGQGWVRKTGGVLVGNGGAWTLRLAGGPTIDERELAASAWIDARLRADFGGGRRSRWGFELEYEGLLDDGGLDGDLRVGPRFRFAVGERHELELFADWLDAGHPLGLQLDTALVGLRYRETPGAALEPPGSAPRILGRFQAGVGNAREAARLALVLRSPALIGKGWLVADFDANALTGEDTGELYYFYRLGWERPWRGRHAGVYFYHRSNHQLAEPSSRITSTNVAEVGLETAGWLDDRARRRFDYRARVGGLISSSFGEDRRWHLWLGGRIRPFAGKNGPWLLGVVEEGDVGRLRLALGVDLGRRYDASVEFREDDQFFGADDDAVLILVGARP